MYYAKSTGGFYSPAIHGENMPRDAVEIGAERHAELLAGQSAGMVIFANDDGYPELREPPALTLAQVLDLRQAAYRLESDPLKIEAEFSAIKNNTSPDYAHWMVKVEEIKLRLPKPLES